MTELPAELTTGERVRYHRERRGMTRPVLAGLVGRSTEWLKKIENGERPLRNVGMLARLAQVLRLDDIGALTGTPGVLPAGSWGKLSHSAVPELREAVHAGAFRRPNDLPTTLDELAGRVRQTWNVWHASAHNRTEVGAVLPDLLLTCHHTARGREGAERRQAYKILVEAYALAQMYAAHIVEPELYWVLVDRARMAAEESDDPVMLAFSAWIAANGLASSGHSEECLRLLADAADSLRPLLEDGSEFLRGTFGSIALKAAMTSAEDGREGDAWRWFGEAERTAQLAPGYWHPWSVFGIANVAVHGVTMAVELKTPGSALRRASEVDPESVPSTERRSRLYIDAARSEYARHEPAGAVHYLKRAFEVSPEGVRYVPAGRSLVLELARTATGPLRADAVELAEAVGVAA
ncbi:transcriptional regulator with XRE-family HTH domain [Kitasatospora sp. MAP12-15]|uniref:helix-turn-helix domain-containing protein n=1 Tax=unclassified Kitasatospora TaxID=2633591 RepID=UPI002473ECEA|nr:helix-turn-helix transcriptional regulator [Kitasatospora sp. MAP12-44]MDH6109459.1 transcriptional regulator with XRE-family HTH domain [Kitasatospora sp. MAP12-44]